MKSLSLLLAFAAFAGAQAPKPANSDCAIDGSVVNALTGEPIVRARVTLQGPNPVSATTDAAGKWTLTGVPCAPLQLAATRPGFLPYFTVNNMATFGSGSPAHDVKIEMTPQSVFVGKVIDDQGDPVTGAAVAALKAGVMNGKITFQPIGQAVTNDLGEYRIPQAPRGKYILCASENGYNRFDGRSIAPSCYPGSVEAGSAGAMDVDSGREMKVDFTLTPAPVLHVRGAISGFANVGVTLVARGANPVPDAIGIGLRDGKFDFLVHAGSYMLKADVFDSGKHLFARVPVEVGSSDVDNLSVSMETGFAIQGSVRIAGQTQQPGGIPRLNLALRSTDPSFAPGPAKWDAESGAFSVAEVMPGTYRLDVFPPAGFYVKSATFAGADILNTDFTVAPGAGPMEIVLADDGGAIEGDIVDGDGKPVEGGVIALRNGAATTVQSTGHFKLQNLAPGDYKVYAWDKPAEVAYAEDDWMRLYAGPAADVTVSAAQTSQVKLTLQNVPR